MNVFTETDIVLEAIGALLTPQPARRRPRHDAESAPRSPAAARAAVNLPHRTLTEPESLSLLPGIRRARRDTIECATFDAALAAAQRVGWPVVLKGVAEGVAHKSELGLVHQSSRCRSFAGSLCHARHTARDRAADGARGTGGDCRRSAGRRAWDWCCSAASAASTPKRCATSASGPIPVSRVRRSQTSWRKAVWGACWPARAGNTRPQRRHS